jgi:hypothetical protein
MVLNYFHTNAEVNEKIKHFFPTLIKKKDRYIEFKVSDRIDFHSIRHFYEQLKSKNLGISQDLLDPSYFYKRYYFTSFNSVFLKKLLILNDSKLFLTFSKPFDKYLIVELGNFDPMLNRRVKFGKAMQVLFKFDSVGLVEDVLYSGVAYN